MKRTNKLKILTVILMAIIVICTARMTFAAQITTIPGSSGNSAGNNTVNNLSSNNTPENNVVPNNTLNTTNYNNVVNNTQNTTLPKTGAELSVGLVGLISFVSISAIYTYIKVKKYNI